VIEPKGLHASELSWCPVCHMLYSDRVRWCSECNMIQHEGSFELVPYEEQPEGATMQVCFVCQRLLDKTKSV